MRFSVIILFVTITLISSCRQDDEIALPCAEDQVNTSYYLDYTPRFIVSDRDAWQFWGFISDSDGNPRKTMRFGERTSNRIHLEEYCTGGMDFTFVEVRQRAENEFYVDLRTMTPVHSTSKLSEPYNWGLSIYPHGTLRITDLPADLDSIELIAANENYTIEVDEIAGTADIEYINLWSGAWASVKISRTSSENAKGYLFRPLISQEISYADFQIDFAPHEIELPYASNWDYEIVGLLDNDFDQKLLLDMNTPSNLTERSNTITIDVPNVMNMTKFLVRLRGYDNPESGERVELYNLYDELPTNVTYEFKDGIYSCIDRSCMVDVSSDFTVTEGRWTDRFTSMNGEEVVVTWTVYMPSSRQEYTLPDWPEKLIDAFPFLAESTTYNHSFNGISFDANHSNQVSIYYFMGRGEDSFWREKKNMSRQSL